MYRRDMHAATDPSHLLVNRLIIQTLIQAPLHCSDVASAF